MPPPLASDRRETLGRAVTVLHHPTSAVSIDSIQEVSEGRQSEIFQRYPDGSFDPNCCFSIYHGSHRESLDLVSPSGDEARTWVTGLRYLMAGISDEDSLARRQRTRDQYPRVQRAGGPQDAPSLSTSVGSPPQLAHVFGESGTGMGSFTPSCPGMGGAGRYGWPCWTHVGP